MIKKTGKDYTPWNFLPENYTPFKQGIDIQREVFKQSMISKDYDTAVIAIENIKAEIKQKIVLKQKKELLKRIQRIINWYKMIPITYTRKTENGYDIILPPTIEFKVQKNLNIAYELIISCLSLLGLI